MLDELTIEDLGVIERASVALGPGLTVVTGETGAGKTMLLTGLALLMGGRADPGSVRPGARQAVAEGRFRLGGSQAAARVVDDAGALLDDDGSVVAVRTVAAEGRSRAHLGGRSVPQAVLADLGSELVTVHGQSDQVRLRTAAAQRAALDAFAGREHGARVERYRAAWAERTRTAAELEALRAAAGERAREAELLRLGLAEVERVDPRPGEDDELAALVARLSHVEDLRTAASTAHDAIVGTEEADAGPGAVTLLGLARRALEPGADRDPALAPLVERLQDAEYVVQDVATELSGYAASLSADPAALEAAHARRAELAALTRTYGAEPGPAPAGGPGAGVTGTGTTATAGTGTSTGTSGGTGTVGGAGGGAGTVDAVLRWASDAGLRLLDLEDDGSRVEAAGARLGELDAQLAALAEEISAARAVAATELADAVTAELAGLAMRGARLQIETERAPEPGPWGIDTVTFALVPHAGAPARPLGKGASGGELSRVMLAVEVALATREADDDAPLPTFVFDEVDAGVGGRTAVEVGRRLAELARRAQVVVVTHLAQVAAFGGTHVVVTRSSRTGAEDGSVAGSDVRVVDGEERVRELARMLSGQDGSTAALQHAAELLATSTAAVAGASGEGSVVGR